MFTNADIKEHRDKLFAHTAAFNVPGIFTRRDEEREAVIKHLEDPGGSVVVLSELLGSGKTFLLQMAEASLKERGLADPDEKVIYSFRRVNESILSSRSSRVLIVDELDKKSERRQIVKTLELINPYLEANIPYLILSGDYTLKDDALLSILSRCRSINLVGLEPLTTDFLLDAIFKRGDYYSDTRGQAQYIKDIFDDEFLRYLVPHTDPPVATFREVLRILMDIAKSDALPLNSKPCKFSEEVCRAWFATSPRSTYDPEQTYFLRWLLDYINDADLRKVPICALSTPQYRRLCPIEGIGSDEGYEERVMDPLTRSNVLRGFGIPYKDGTGRPRREPGSYLPTVMTFLHSMYDEWWP